MKEIKFKVGEPNTGRRETALAVGAWAWTGKQGNVVSVKWDEQEHSEGGWEWTAAVILLRAGDGDVKWTQHSVTLVSEDVTEEPRVMLDRLVESLEAHVMPNGKAWPFSYEEAEFAVHTVRKFYGRVVGDKPLPAIV